MQPGGGRTRDPAVVEITETARCLIALSNTFVLEFHGGIGLSPSRHAFGERTLEATELGVREFSPAFSFASAWSNLGFVAVTSSHLFIAHTSMNAHIVPLRFFESDSARDSFISFAKRHVHRAAEHYNDL